jgi:hypothetical protein
MFFTHSVVHYSTHWAFSVRCVFSSRCLMINPNSVLHSLCRSLQHVPSLLSPLCSLLPSTRSQVTAYSSVCCLKTQLNCQLSRKLEVEVKLRPTVSRPVRLDVRHSSGTSGQFFFLLEIVFRQLRVCYFVAPSLTRGRVFNLLLLLVSLAQSHSGLSPAGLKTIFYSSNFLDSPNLEGQAPVFISPRNRVAQIYPQALGSLSVASYDSQGYGGGILSRLHMGDSWAEAVPRYIAPA